MSHFQDAPGRKTAGGIDRRDSSNSLPRLPGHQAAFSGLCRTEEAHCRPIKILKDAARNLQMWRPFLLNWRQHPISTGKPEATNRKIGTLQRNACGYRDDEYLTLRILNIHKATYALTG